VRRILPVLIALGCLLFPAQPLTVRAAGEQGPALESHVRYLAGDDLAGRLPGTPGIDQAAAYIARQFEAIGLEPAFDTSYYQEFMIPFGHMVVGPPRATLGGLDLEPGVDFQVLPFSGSDTLSAQAAFGAGDQHTQTSGGDVLLISVDPEIESERWTLMGRDGLAVWMRETADRAASSGASAVIFIGDSPGSAGGLHTFGISRSYRPVKVPVIELAYEAYKKVARRRGFSPELDGGLPDAGKGTGDIRLDFELRADVRARRVWVKNVGAMLPGSERSGRYIVVGAHYDHLGYGEIASSTPWRREVHNGADDNASGVAAVIEIARMIAGRRPAGASIGFICFTAEELGALGSEHFVENCPFPVDSTMAMINLDTVGRLVDGKLIMFGARSAEEFDGVLDSALGPHQIQIVKKKEIYGFSDQNAFYARGVPSLHVFTGAHDDYHSPDDDADLINFEGLATITAYTADVVDAVAALDGLTPVTGAEEPSPGAVTRGKGAYLGIIPDFTYEGSGVGIGGTTPDSPASAAGLMGGDVIIAIDGEPIGDLQALMRFLAGKNPGDKIEISVMRGPLAETFAATLSVRAERRDPR
jgi:hypothetical protein